LKISSLSILVVDDFEPFRRLVCSILDQDPRLHVACEAVDGREAVQYAERLQPDLILLDIGLPKMNGIEAARRIRTLSPGSRILFLSQTSDVDVVQETLSLGAQGYVLKSQVGGDLRAAVEAVLRGERFVSEGLKHGSVDAQGKEDSNNTAGQGLSLVPSSKGPVSRWHECHFHLNEESLLAGFTGFIETALAAGKVAIAITSKSHREGLLRRLRLSGMEISAAIEHGRYIALDVEEIFPHFMVHDLPDPVRFFKAAHECITRASGTASGQPLRVAACGEGTSMLWTQGKANAAVQLERLWDDIARTYDMEILCGYLVPRSQREQQNETYVKICAAHSAICLQ
jgi:DNA-binding NarL/FixJ family response regulator